MKPNHKFHKDMTSPENNEIFVFGSNLKGVHGAGAAAKAMDFGAVYGKGLGRVGRTFAIPTKDHNIETLPLDEVKAYIDIFVLYTQDTLPLDERFFVTRVGCVLAGYSDAEIAPLFKNAMNCSFAEEWRKYLIED